MYSLDINFLKERSAYNNESKRPQKKSFSVGSLTPIYLGVALGVFLPAVVGVGWWMLQAKNVELDQKVAQLDEENKKLETQIGEIKKIREQTNKVKGETQALVTVFDQIRPWSAMLQDLRDRIPAKVQIETIKQTAPIASEKGQPSPNPAGGIEINGFAGSFNDVNDFLLTLQQSQFFKASDSKITTAELVNAPVATNANSTNKNTVLLPPPQIVKYTIQSNLSDIPASDLIQELEKKGTVGLVTRIRSMQQTGVITK